MADTYTPTIDLVKPELAPVGDVWGEKLNDNADKIDAHAAAVLAALLAAKTPRIACRAFRTAPQSIPAGALTQIEFNYESFDVGSNFDTSAGHYHFTAPENGYYLITASASFESLPADRVAIGVICIDGTEWAYDRRQSSTSGDISAAVTDFVYLAAGAVVDFRVRHTHSGTINILSGSDGSFFSCVKMGL